jgi:biopolymer transport protein ExbB
MWPLLFCSIVAISVFLDRLVYFHRATIQVGEFLQGLSNLIHKKNYAEALHECAATPGPVARVIHAAILRHGHPRSELREVVQEAGQLEVPKLERKIAIVGTIALVAPLIGLLGTVSGMIDVFTTISAGGGYATATDLSAGLYQSLITTAAGLAIAIPAHVVHGYLSAWVTTLMHDMERAGIEIVNLLTDTQRNEGIIEFGAQRRTAAGE